MINNIMKVLTALFKRMGDDTDRGRKALIMCLSSLAEERRTSISPPSAPNPGDPKEFKIPPELAERLKSRYTYELTDAIGSLMKIGPRGCLVGCPVGCPDSVNSVNSVNSI